MPHTPGPWEYTEGSKDLRQMSTIKKAGQDDMLIGYAICEHANVRQREEDIANARLIAAAPDLLAACKLANECLDNLMKAVPWGKTFDLDIAALNQSLLLLPKAIAKAEGGGA